MNANSNTQITGHIAEGLVALLLMVASADLLMAGETETALGGKPLEFKTISKPQWEFGVAAAALKVPAYPASAEKSERQFFVPWFVYRGDKVRLQDGGLKLIALQNSRVTIDVSISASLNADSEEAPLRQGMPNLDYLLELGPRADVRLLDETAEDGRRYRLNWSTALRQAVSTDFSSITARGPVLGTELRYKYEGLNDGRTTLSASLGSWWGGEKIMDYFYQVDAAFETPQRATYDARAGYIGSAVGLSVGHEFNRKISAFIGFRLSLFDGAKNGNSPLYEDETNTGVFGGVSWALKESSATIDVLDAN